MLPRMLEKHLMPSRTNMTHGNHFLKVYWKNMCQKLRKSGQKDEPYRTEEWKMEGRNKRKYVQLFAQN